MLKYRGAECKVPKMGQQTSKSTTPTFDREVNTTEIRFNDPTLLQEPRPGFRVQSSGFRVQSSEFRVFSIHTQLTSLDPTMLQEPPVSIHNQCTIAVHNSSSMTHHPHPSIDIHSKRSSASPASSLVQGSECRVQGSEFRVQGSEFRVQSSEFRVFSTHTQLTSLDPTMLQEPLVFIHNQCTIAVHNSSSMTHHPHPSI